MKIKSIVDYTKQYVEKGIIKGEWVLGQQIKEEEIASRLDISRPPIREAFKILEAEGLVKRIPRRGVFVSEITKEDIWEIYTLKAALHGLATRLAIDKISEKEVRKLDNILQLMEKCVEKEPSDLIEYQNLNESFHFMMIDIAGNARLKRIAASLSNQTKMIHYRYLRKREHLLSSYQFHRKILEAIKSKQKALAERLTRKHIQLAMKVLYSMQGHCVSSRK